jgi:hypothetical protein
MRGKKTSMFIAALVGLAMVFGLVACEEKKSAPEKIVIKEEIDDSIPEMTSIVLRAMKGDEQVACYIHHVTFPFPKMPELNTDFLAYGGEYNFRNEIYAHFNRNSGDILSWETPYTYSDDRERKCSDEYNKDACEKVAKDVEKWKGIIKWHERVPRLLKERGLKEQP